jgi:hypothetical protein
VIRSKSRLAYAFELQTMASKLLRSRKLDAKLLTIKERMTSVNNSLCQEYQLTICALNRRNSNWGLLNNGKTLLK